jgi:hypothetical protein
VQAWGVWLQVNKFEEPRCEAHGLKITACLTCCIRIYENAGDMHADLRHSWAMANVYLRREEW